MAKPIHISGIRGMSNVPDQWPTTSFIDQLGVATPRVVHNADVYGGSMVTKRKGYTKKITLVNPHSISKRLSALLCMGETAGGTQALYRIVGDSAVELCDVDGPKAQTHYVEADGKIYISNRHWCGVLDLSTGTVRDWGMDLPPSPKISLIDGGFPPAAYSFCYTYFGTDGMISGNGPISRLSFEGQSRGFHVVNPPANTFLWISDPNSGDFYLAGPSSTSDFTSPYFTTKLPSLFVTKPEPMGCLCHAFGRMWGSVQGGIIYSQPFALEWFRPTNQITLPMMKEGEVIHTLSWIKEGLYAASDDSTWFLEGTSPEAGKMSAKWVDTGVVAGTLEYMPAEETGQEIATWRHKTFVPVWINRDRGWVVGNQHGRPTTLAEARILTSPGPSGAALFRVQRGEPQLLVTMSSGEGGDDLTRDVISDGQVF